MVLASAVRRFCGWRLDVMGCNWMSFGIYCLIRVSHSNSRGVTCRNQQVRNINLSSSRLVTSLRDDLGYLQVNEHTRLDHKLHIDGRRAIIDTDSLVFLGLLKGWPNQPIHPITQLAKARRILYHVQEAVIIADGHPSGLFQKTQCPNWTHARWMSSSTAKRIGFQPFYCRVTLEVAMALLNT
ncbi:hypothetical protein CHS0354_013340 [Potamilus streckersoni]|uniref:Uncharacterized protein n=1 Tax=Potamilus streckersoni TaxID=2493646 RepID=A0AAE0T349_9BIVA|nr:hypothetical protein CHS0354_013340 [Potamilus streckersoni]